MRGVGRGLLAVAVVCLGAGCASVGIRSAGPTCGDGVVEATEACDDGDADPGDGCSEACEVEAGWSCAGEPSVCTLPAAVCGDGQVEGDEECDDGGESPACDVDCTFVVCGDGLVNGLAPEFCDEGGETATCDADCTLPQCGDGTVNTAAGESCDDAGESAACNADCTPAQCGDGMVNAAAGEGCDDGNRSPGDGCDASCQVESGCSAAAVAEETFGAGMYGCAGTVAHADRATLCAPTHRVCSAVEWVANRAAAAPRYHYWVDTLLTNWSGTDGSCMAHLTAPGGTACTVPGLTMRVCSPDNATFPHPDPLGNACNFVNCGLDSTVSEHFGGCNDNTTAGALCCP